MNLMQLFLNFFIDQLMNNNQIFLINNMSLMLNILSTYLMFHLLTIMLLHLSYHINQQDNLHDYHI